MALTRVRPGGVLAGGVLQVLQSPDIDAYSNTDGSYSERASLTITPLKADSKFLIFTNVFVNNYVGSSTNSYAGVKYKRDVAGAGDTDIFTMTIANKVYGQSIGSLIALGNQCGPLQVLDDPAYTIGQSIDYSIHLAETDGGTAAFSDDGKSNFTVMEIAQ